MFGMGCFWGAERKFWELGEGIHVSAVGYAGGLTPNPTYREVCSGMTGHAEVVLVAYDPAWPRHFAREAERIRGALGARALGARAHAEAACLRVPPRSMRRIPHSRTSPRVCGTLGQLS